MDTGTAGNTSSFSGTVSNGSNLLTLQGSGSGAYSGNIGNGSGGVTIAGTGTWTLSGSNTYTGLTAVTSGELDLNTPGADGVTAMAVPGNLIIGNGTAAAAVKLLSSNQIAATSAVQIDGTDGALNLNNNNLTIASLSDRFGGTGTAGTVSLGSGTLTVGDTTSFTFSGGIGGAGSLIKQGNGTMILAGSSSYSGGTTVNAGVLNVTGSLQTGSALTAGASGAANIGTTNANLGAVTDNNTMAIFGINFSATTGTVTLASLSGVGNTYFAAGFTDSSTYTQGNTTVIGTATLPMVTSGTLNLDGATSFITTLNGGTVNLLSDTLTVTNGNDVGTINGFAGNLVKTGTSNDVLTLSGSNSYNGSTSINAGTLSLNNANALGATYLINFNGGTLQYTSNNNNDYSNVFSTANNQLYIIDTNGQNVTFATALTSSGGSLTKLGLGTLTLTGSNTFNGGVTIQNGTLAVPTVNNANTNGSLGNNPFVTLGSIGNTGTLEYTSAVDATSNMPFSLTLGGSGGIQVDNSNNLTLNGLISGSGALVISSAPGMVVGTVTLTGNGTVTLTNTNTFSGGLSVISGILAVPTVNNALTNGPLGNNSTVTLGSSGNTGTLEYTTAADATSTMNFTMATGGTGTLQVNSNNLTLTGLINGSGALAVAANAGTITLNNNPSNNNSYSGGLKVLSGTLNTDNVNNTGSNGPLGTSSVALGSTAGTTGTLEYTGTSVTSSMPFNLLSNSSSQGGGTFQIDSASTNLTLTGLISGGASGQTINLNKSGAGTLTLNNSNSSFFGTTTIRQGTLVTNSIANAGVNSSIGSSGSIKLNSGATFQYTGGLTSTNRSISMNASATLDASGSGPISFTNIALITGTLVLGSVSATVTLTGSNTGLNKMLEKITNPGSLTLTSIIKNGPGTWDLAAGANTYGGTTTINQGILEVDTNNALGATAGGTTVSATGAELRLGNVSYTTAEPLTINGTGVSNAGALSNTGTSIFAGAITVASNATIGSGGGTLTLTGGIVKNGTTLTLVGGGVININTVGISGSSPNSDLIVNGTTANLNVTNSYNGPTSVMGGGNIVLGVNNAIPNNSAVTLGDGSTTGILTMGTLTNAIGSLTFGTTPGGGTVKMAASQSGAAPSAQLSASGAVDLGSGNTLDLTGMGTSAGVYRLISGSSLANTFTTVTGLSSNYLLVYNTLNPNELDAQHKATIGTITATPANARILTTTTSTTFDFTVQNSAGSGGASLNFTATAGTNVTGGPLGPITVAAAATSGSTSGFTFNNPNSGAGNQTGTFAITDANATNSPQTGTVTVDVVNQRTFNAPAINLGRFLLTGAPSGTSAISSTGLNNVTANATLGSFSGIATDGLTLSTSDSTVFNGGVNTQTANYNIGGTATTAGAISGSFTAPVTAELGSIPDVTVNLTGNALNLRTFTAPATADLGNYLVNANVAINSNQTITTAGLHDVTTDSTLGTATNGPLNGLSLTGGPTFIDGTNATDNITRTISGTLDTGTYYTQSQTFNMNATDELAGTVTNAASVSYSVNVGNATAALSDRGGNNTANRLAYQMTSTESGSQTLFNGTVLTGVVGNTGSYAGLASRTMAGGTVLGTVATILTGSNSSGSDRTVTMTWRDRASVERPGGSTPPLPTSPGSQRS